MSMSSKTISGGYASEYDNQLLWVEKAEIGAEAAMIMDDSEYTPCVITKLIFRSDYVSEEDYNEACDEIAENSTAACTGEFITIEEIYYVELDSTGDVEVYESIDYDDVTFC